MRRSAVAQQPRNPAGSRQARREEIPLRPARCPWSGRGQCLARIFTVHRPMAARIRLESAQRPAGSVGSAACPRGAASREAAIIHALTAAVAVITINPLDWVLARKKLEVPHARMAHQCRPTSGSRTSVNAGKNGK